MKVRHLLIGTSLLATMTLSAQAHQGNFSGFYAGAQYGSVQSKANALVQAESNPGGGGAAEKFHYKRNLSNTNTIGGLHAGYGQQFSNCVYMGVEAYGNLSNHAAQTSFEDAANYTSAGGFHGSVRYNRILKLERKHTLGLALRPGVVFGNTLLYAKLGLETANMSVKDSPEDMLINRGGMVIEKEPSSSTHKWVMGFVPGVGASFRVTDNLLLGLEATHAMYKDAKFNLSKKNSKASFKSQTYNEFFARVSYKW